MSKEEEKEGETHVDKQLMEMMDEFEEPSANTYAKFKTQHEIEIGEAYKTGPARLLLDDMDELLEFGQIV